MIAAKPASCSAGGWNVGEEATLQRIQAWSEEEYAKHRAERKESASQGDEMSAACEVGAMLAHLELQSLLIRMGLTLPVRAAIVEERDG